MDSDQCDVRFREFLPQSKSLRHSHVVFYHAQMNAIAQLLSMSVADLEGVATFYNRIYRHPVGPTITALYTLQCI
jgi:NADH:ubiquinone oxidoreductase subunit E